MSIIIPKQSRDNSSIMRKIVVQGDSLKDVEAAISEINIQRITIDIEDEHVDYVCGDNDSNIDFMASKSGVITLQIEKNPETNSYQLVAVGLQQQIEDLRTVYDSYMNYYEQFNSVKQQTANSIKNKVVNNHSNNNGTVGSNGTASHANGQTQ